MATAAEKEQTVWLKRTLWFVGAVYGIFFFVLGPWVGPHDFNHLSGYYELAWRFWKTQNGLPGFNPFLCGGRTLAGDPQIPIYHPFTFLVGWLGPTVVLRWEMLGQIALGAWGMNRLLKYFELPEASRVWGVLVFVAGGGVLARFEVGHVTLGFLSLFPLFLFLSYEIGAGRNVARNFCWYVLLFVYSGLYKPNFFAYAVPLLGVEVIARAAFQRRLSVIAAFAAAVGLAAGVDAISLLPAADYFARFPRTSAAEAKWTWPWAFLANVLMPLRTIPKAWYGLAPIQRHEYNIFVGPIALLFAGLALKTRPWRPEVRALVVWAAISAFLGLGTSDLDFHFYSPYSWLAATWPGFATLRVPTRLWFGAFTAFAILSAIGFRNLTWGMRQTCFWFFGVLPLVLGAVANLGKTFMLSEQTQGQVSREYPKQITLAHLSHPDLGLDEVRQGKSIYECVDNLQAYRAPLEEKSLLDISTPVMAAVSAEWETWSRIQVTARAADALPITLNLNHSDLWRWEGTAAQIISSRGQPLALRSDTGELKGALIFEQPGTQRAALISATFAPVVFLAIAFTLWRTRKRRVLDRP